ncbi:Hemimethylated DNA-binding protein YccV like-domain-containing protein [Amylocarpus encephaloides]|uniref:Hemimethylated DNA-binding protein YccV like-domain-containing protein n=1 Tax=Amylocarpus encephaloides TaxID=45428 RepID=A0A9P7YAP7_9HELO|nr:Hemimethylated DNA-binding protein YccV like-domain-containing protein [Amylocarpus encephaloides]
MPSLAKPPSLKELPDEVLQHILYFISPDDIIFNTLLVSKRLYALSIQPLLWRQHCRREFQYWDAKHRIRQKLGGEVSDVDWKSLYVYRRKVDQKTTQLLNGILGSQVDRIQKYSDMTGVGYDAKDTLLRHCRTDDNAEDVLARRFYATSVLDHLHRSQALAEWQKILDGENISLERALGSFDLFVLHDHHGDLLEISEVFDNWAEKLRLENPAVDRLPMREKALLVAAFVRTNDLVGCGSDAYRDLRNSFIGIALQQPSHPSLPLISVAIFVCIARRFGLDARSCGVPNHVHAMVFSSKTESLDGHDRERYDDDLEQMFLDPFHTDQEVPIENLWRFLSTWGIPKSDFPRFLKDSHFAGLILRTSRNILASIQEFRNRNGDNFNHPTIQLHANPFADMENAFYAALWANYMFGRPTMYSDAYNQRQFVPLILERYERLYPMDSDLIERYICPLFNNPHILEHLDLYEAVRIVRVVDQTPRQERNRDNTSLTLGVKFRVGQVFRHRRYGYTAVIIGWDSECGMDPQWIETNGVDNLSRGRNQSFYHALVEDTSIRYVAQENIEELSHLDAGEPLMSIAGRYFKRWDDQKYVFVSNIRDEYPCD